MPAGHGPAAAGIGVFWDRYTMSKIDRRRLPAGAGLPCAMRAQSETIEQT
jgi:hypothetical protein